MKIRPQTTADTEAIAAWRYPGRYSTYDVGDVAEIDASAGGWAVVHEGELVGYCSFGASARVPEIDEEEVHSTSVTACAPISSATASAAHSSRQSSTSA